MEHFTTALYFTRKEKQDDKVAWNSTEHGCDQSVMPTDPLLAGPAVGTSAAFSSTQAQEGDPGSACLDRPPSAVL